MSVSNGSLADQTTFNSAFVSRTVNTNTIGKLDLENTDAASGGSIINAQREHNSAASFMGKAINAAKNALPSWTDTSVGTSLDSLFARAEALTAEFNPATGHTHNGTDAPKVAAANVTSVAAGDLAATDVQAALNELDSEKIPKVVSTNNAIVRFNGTTGLVKDSGVLIDDSDNVTIPGDLTVNGTTTTLNTSTLDVEDVNITINKGGNDASSEGAGLTVERTGTAGSFVYADALASKFKLGALGSEGEVTTSGPAQTVSGAKTLVDKLTLQKAMATEREDVASAATIAALSSTKSFVKLTGATATDIQGITAGTDGQVLTIHNGSTQTMTLKHQDGAAAAANRIKLVNALDLPVLADSSVAMIYDTGQSRWVIKSGAGASSGGGALVVTGTRAAPENITAGGGIAFTGAEARQMWFIQGSPFHVDITATPQIAAASVAGQELILVGRNDDRTVLLEDGTGLSLNGSITMGENSVLTLVWDGVNWVEVSRRN